MATYWILDPGYSIYWIFGLADPIEMDIKHEVNTGFIQL